MKGKDVWLVKLPAGVDVGTLRGKKIAFNKEIAIASRKFKPTFDATVRYPPGAHTQPRLRIPAPCPAYALARCACIEHVAALACSVGVAAAS